MEPLNLYLIAPKGHENMVLVTPASSEETAIEQANMVPAIKVLTDRGIELNIKDISTQLAMKGFSVLVSKVGIFH